MKKARKVIPLDSPATIGAGDIPNGQIYVQTFDKGYSLEIEGEVELGHLLQIAAHLVAKVHKDTGTSIPDILTAVQKITNMYMDGRVQQANIKGGQPQ